MDTTCDHCGAEIPLDPVATPGPRGPERTGECPRCGCVVLVSDGPRRLPLPLAS